MSAGKGNLPRRRSMSEKKFAGLGVSELWQLRQMQDENTRLQGLLADLTLHKQILREVIGKKP